MYMLKYVQDDQLTVGDFVVNPWSTVYWTLAVYVRMAETVLS
jgi:hypothetical protein